MSSFKDRLKESQGQGSSFPRLPVVHTVELKEAGTDIEFQVYDKDQKANVKYADVISGILIGTAMQVSSYSDNLGRNGGQYKSDFYVNNKNVVLFGPTAKGYEVMCKGTMDEVEKYINDNSTGSAKKRQAIFVLTPAGLLAVVTNLSIAIDQIGKYREELTEKQIVLTPTLFNEKDESISKKAKEYLGKFRQKNPPKYAAISIGQPITEELWEALKADYVIEQFTAWKKYKEAGGQQVQEALNEPAQDHNYTTAQSQAASMTQEPFDDDIDHLPF